MTESQRKALAGFTHNAMEHGRAIGWQPEYPETVCIACPCGHLSIRERANVAAYICPSCESDGK